MADWPQTPTGPQAGMTRDQWSAAAADVFSYLLTVLPDVADLKPFVDALPVLLASVNYAGKWDDLAGPLDSGVTAYHDGAVYLLLVDLADVTSVEPGTDAATWFTIPRPSKQLEYRSLAIDHDAVEMALPDGWAWFLLKVENILHNADSDRALMLAFSTDDITGDVVYGDPVEVTPYGDNTEEMGVDVTLCRSDLSARGACSSRTGQLGSIVPAGATAMRIGVGRAGGMDGAMTPNGSAMTFTLIGYASNAT